MNYILVVIVGLEPTTYSVWRKCTAIVLYHHNHFRITLNNSYCAGTHTFRHCQVTDAVAATLAVLAPLNMILKWWMRLESNQQCQRRRIYSPLGLPIFLHIHFKNNSRLCELICILRLFVFSCPGSYDCSVTSKLGAGRGIRTLKALMLTTPYYVSVQAACIRPRIFAFASEWSISSATPCETPHKNLIQKLTAICIWIQWSLQAVLNILHCWNLVYQLGMEPS